MQLEERFKVLVEGAKYDVSCSSSGGGLPGVCHSFTPDGRCISLLKVLMSNRCAFNCSYCVNRSTANAVRAVLSPDEICRITTEFYKRNYIEGLFLSSGVEKSPAYTMEKLLETVKKLRLFYGFRGYIHLKVIPGTQPEIITECAKYVNRMSVNIEFPCAERFTALAPQKSRENVLAPMRHLSFLTAQPEKKLIPAGQTTQMVIGATPDTDKQIVSLAEGLYKKFGLKRVYYSAYIPVSEALEKNPPNLVRENRLYQADWLLRFYGFSGKELFGENENLALWADPKTAWALAHPEIFPVEINTAPHELLLRVPGIGARCSWRIITARKNHRLCYDDLVKLKVNIKRAKNFITCDTKYFGQDLLRYKNILMENCCEQLAFEDSASGVLTGEL